MAEAGGEVLVAAVDGVDIAKNGLAGGGEHADENDDGGAKGLRSDEFGGAPVGGSFDVDAVSVEEFDFDVKVGEFSSVDSAVFENPVVDEGAAFGHGGDDGEEGKIVDIEARERHGVNFVDRCDEAGFLDV